MFDDTGRDPLKAAAQLQTDQDAINIPESVIKQLDTEISFKNNFAAFTDVYELLQALSKALQSSGELYAGIDITVPIEGEKQPKKLRTIDVDKILAENRAAAQFPEIKRSDISIPELLTHLDVLRILTGAIRLLRQEDVSLLTNWVALDKQDLWIIKQWLSPGSKYNEVELVRKKGADLRKLLDEVLNAAAIYQQKHQPIDFTKYLDRTAFEALFYAHLTTLIAVKVPDYDKVKNWSEHEEEQKKLYQAITERLRSDQYFDAFFTSSRRAELEKNQLISSQGTYAPDLIDSEWYSLPAQQELREQLITRFIARHGTELSQQFIAPLLEKPSQETVATTTSQTPEETEGSETDTPPTDEETLIAQHQFIELVENTAWSRLVSEFVTSAQESLPVLANLDSQQQSAVAAWVTTRLPQAVADPEQLSRFITGNWNTWTQQYQAFFSTTLGTDSQPATIPVVSYNFLNQAIVQDAIASFITSQIPVLHQRLDAELTLFVRTELLRIPTEEPTPTGNFVSREDFVQQVRTKAEQSLVTWLISGWLELSPATENFISTNLERTRAWATQRVQDEARAEEHFARYLQTNWARLASQHSRFFSTTLNENNLPTYLIDRAFINQSVIVSEVVSFIQAELQRLHAILDPQFNDLVAAQQQPEPQQEADATTSDQTPSEAASAVVPETTTAPQAEQATTLSPEAESKLFFATAGLLTTAILGPYANQRNVDLNDIDPALRAELQRVAEQFLREHGGDLRLTPSKRLELLRQFRTHLEQHYRPSSATGITLTQLLHGQTDDSIYNHLNTELKEIAQFDNFVATVVLKQKIDAFLLTAGGNLDFLKTLDLTIEADLNKFLQIIQLPISDSQPVTREIAALLARNPQLTHIIRNYMYARSAELSVAIQTKDSAQQSDQSKSEAQKLLETSIVSQTHTIVQSLAAHGRHQDKGEAAETAGKIVSQNKQENLTDRANWLLKQNHKQYGQIWRILTQEQQAAVYAKISEITGILEYPPQNYDPALGYPIPAGIGVVSIADILAQLKQARSDNLTTEDVLLIDQLERSQEMDEYRSLLLADQLQQQLVADFLAELDAETMAAMAAELATQDAAAAAYSAEQLQQQFSYTELAGAAIKAAESQDTNNPYKRNLFSRISGYKPDSRAKKTQSASKKALDNTASLIKTGKMLAQMTSFAGLAKAGLEFLANPSKENLKKLGVMVGGMFAPYIPLLFSLGAQIGFGIGAVLGGVATWLTGGAFALPIMATATIGGTWLGLGAERLITNARNALLGNNATSATAATTPATGAAIPAAAPAAPVGNVASPKHAVQPRFAPRPEATGATQTAASQAPQASAGTTAASSSVAAPATGMAAIAALPIAVLAPAAMAIAVTVIGFITVFIIFSAFLVPIPGGGEGYTSVPLEGFEGCWPTTGVITQLRTHFNKETGQRENHAVINRGITAVVDASGKQQFFAGPGSAIDIGFNGVGGLPDVYAPFSGFASYYPMGHGIQAGANYGHHIVIVTPTFVIILAHLQGFDTAIPMDRPTHKAVVAGEKLGIMGTTGNSTGPHVHYEVLGLDILQLLPLSPADREKYAQDELAMQNIPVDAQECATPTTPTNGYLAIGPATADNIQVSTTAEISASPVTTCSWKNTRGLTAAINANFYNTPYTPIGIAGSGPARYYANADDRPIKFIEQLMSLLVSPSGTVLVQRPNPTLNQGPFPVLLPEYDKGVTGLFVASDEPDTEVDQRTALGVGVSNGTCETTYSGKFALFLAVMPEATYYQIEQELRRCGATKFIHFDGGSSSTFCSNTLNFDRSKPVPVHVGLQEAVISRIGGGAGSAPIPSPSPAN